MNATSGKGVISMKNLSKIVWGLVLIAAGVLFGLNALGVTDVKVFFDGWWTLFIIIPCFVGLFTDRNKTGNIVGLLLGVILLLCMQNVIDFDSVWKLVLPAVVVIIGLSMLFGGIGFKGRKFAPKVSSGNATSCFAAFSGKNMNFDGQTFRGAEINAVFGGIKCDLTNAVFEGDSVINATAIFGGIDIIVPAGVNVEVRSDCFFGGVTDKGHVNISGNPYTVYVNATGIFGGVEIK